jgi:hypothetical protein
MSTVSDGDLLRVSAQTEFTGKGAVDNVYVFRWTGVIPAADADVMLHVGEYMEVVYSELDGSMTDQQVFTAISCYNITQDRPMPTIAWPTLEAGALAFDPTATGVAMFAYFRTGQPRTIARKFLGVFTKNELQGADWTAGIIVGVLAGLVELLEPHLSLSDNGVLTYGVIDKGGVFRQVIDVTVDTIPAYQRRRRQGRGG